MSEHLVKTVTVWETDLSAYGEVVAPQVDRKADSSGQGWTCWYPLAELAAGAAPAQIGLVRVDLTEPVVRLVESHPTREEWVYAIDTPVIQVVALTGSDGSGLADAGTARAVLLNPGEGLLIRAGVWHAPAFAASLGKGQYGFVLAASRPEVKELGLVPFADGYSLRVEVDKQG